MGDSHELRELGPPKDLAPSEVLQVNSSNHLPLDVTSIDLVRRRLKQRHIQMYVRHSFPYNFLGTHWSLTTG